MKTKAHIFWWESYSYKCSLNSASHFLLFFFQGCGDKIRFWEYCWTSEDVPLMLKYPRLYQISSQQQQLIMQMGRHFDEGWEWNYSWRRPLFDNEVATADEFLRETANLLIHPNKADLWVGKADPSGSYSTKSAYKLLRGDSRGEHQDGAFVELWLSLIHI